MTVIKDEVEIIEVRAGFADNDYKFRFVKPCRARSAWRFPVESPLGYLSIRKRIDCAVAFSLDEYEPAFRATRQGSLRMNRNPRLRREAYYIVTGGQHELR